MQTKVTGELTTRFIGGEVEIEQTGLGFKYEISISSLDVALVELRQIVEWLEEVKREVDQTDG